MCSSMRPMLHFTCIQHYQDKQSYDNIYVGIAHIFLLGYSGTIFFPNTFRNIYSMRMSFPNGKEKGEHTNSLLFIARNGMQLCNTSTSTHPHHYFITSNINWSRSWCASFHNVIGDTRSGRAFLNLPCRLLCYSTKQVQKCVYLGNDGFDMSWSKSLINFRKFSKNRDVLGSGFDRSADALIYSSYRILVHTHYINMSSKADDIW